MKHDSIRVPKEKLANLVSLAPRKALTFNNIQSDLRRGGIWPLNLEATKLKIDPSEGFKKQTTTKFVSE